jgi:hypothetical protein
MIKEWGKKGTSLYNIPGKLQGEMDFILHSAKPAESSALQCKTIAWSNSLFSLEKRKKNHHFT